MSEQVEFTTKNIRERTRHFSPEVAIVLGTGLGGLAQEISVSHSLPYNSIPNFAAMDDDGGRLIFGELGGKKVVAMQKRYHFYEGYSMQEIGFPIRVMSALGAKKLCVSNASGGMNPAYEVGELVAINDHINFFSTNPLIGKNDDSAGPRFVDMSETYKKSYIELAKQIARTHGIELKEGVYVGLSGPCFETPAEYRFLWRMGADIVGMSTVPEVIVAKHAGMDVFGISIVTDLGAEGRVETVTLEEVIRIAKLQEPKMTLIMKELISQM